MQCNRDRILRIFIRTRTRMHIRYAQAWAKLHLSYEATAGGMTEDACSYLTAGLSLSRSLSRSRARARTLSAPPYLSPSLPPSRSPFS